jgi:multimeric flavodoxin WrbA
LRAFALNCTLKKSPAASSTDLMVRHVLDALAAHGVESDHTRFVDHDIRHGVSSDEGDGDQWLDIRRRVLDADIFVLATPIWMGHPASPCQQALERLDAMIAETDEAGRMIATDRVAIVAVVGNEDGAHHVGAEVFQGLDDIGFTIPANGMTYWVGEAMQSKDYKDLDEVPDAVAQTTATMARNAVHLARCLAEHPYPATS